MRLTPSKADYVVVRTKRAGGGVVSCHRSCDQAVRAVMLEDGRHNDGRAAYITATNQAAINRLTWGTGLRYFWEGLYYNNLPERWQAKDGEPCVGSQEP